MVATTRKAADNGLSRVKKALEKGENLLSAAQVDFVQTCCRILGIDSEEKSMKLGAELWRTVRGRYGRS
jgi:hypothetical protein